MQEWMFYEPHKVGNLQAIERHEMLFASIPRICKTGNSIAYVGDWQAHEVQWCSLFIKNLIVPYT